MLKGGVKAGGHVPPLPRLNKERHRQPSRQQPAGRWLWFAVIGLCALSSLCVKPARSGVALVFLHGTSPSAATPLIHRLVAIESELSGVWNRSKSAVLVGHKAQRDFGVYAWAFQMHGYRVFRPETGVILFETSGRADLPGVGAVLCHSILTFNCFRERQRALSKAYVADERRDARVYTWLSKGTKVNRISAARAVLTTKDGFCATLHASRLADDELHDFTFPCWSLPADLLSLRQLVNQENHSRGNESFSAGRVSSLSNRLSGSSTWIVKPKRGSMGGGIRVLEHAELAALLSQRPVELASLIVQPYLTDPLLHDGRKWDMRTYVLVTSVQPMRVYLFTEAIVRFASTPYSSASREDGVVLTNTFVGKRVLKQGVRSITGALARLCPLFTLPTEEGDTSTSTPYAHDCDALINAMRTAVGRLFLSAEARFVSVYRSLYPSDRSERSDARSTFRCTGCYHLFGVDLIADSSRQLRVIEVNIAPDLTLSTEGSACNAPAASAAGSNASTRESGELNSSRGCEGVSQSLAHKLDSCADLVRVRFPQLLEQPYHASSNASRLQAWVLEYLLETMREGPGIGCFTAVYPNTVHHAAFASHLRRLLQRSVECGTNAASPGECQVAAKYWDDRNAVHELIHLLLTQSSDINASRGQRGLQMSPWRPPYRERCQKMLRQVVGKSKASGDSRGNFAKRTHIFNVLSDLEE
ncbi:hypothetical protein AB1Y20_008431 [Prymnesium parvum]|uniref:Tubulin--tyrosine ligase-like protein 9 n=2 Tax=Prymnesium parvum TaxID=97485 RepID=A0AB34IR92_PRYPA